MMHRSCLAAQSAVALILAAAVLLTGCAHESVVITDEGPARKPSLVRAFQYRTGGMPYLITPPGELHDPVAVYLVDYGKHSSVLLPHGNGGVVEYAYGEWNWFALGREGGWRVVPTLGWPTQGTLGRRTRPFSDLESLRTIEHESIWQFDVERDRADTLLRELDRRYEANAASMVFRPDYPMFFVRDPEAYHALNNCNHVTARWLRALGCDVRGNTPYAIFFVRQPQGD